MIVQGPALLGIFQVSDPTRDLIPQIPLRRGPEVWMISLSSFEGIERRREIVAANGNHTDPILISYIGGPKNNISFYFKL